MKALYLAIAVTILMGISSTPVFGKDLQTRAPSGNRAFDNAPDNQPDNQYEEAIESMPDPIEPFNRLMFQVNDKLYFYFFKPVAKGYSFVVPEDARVSVSNFFSNIATPIRLANCLLQGKITDASNEFTRFCLNSIYGIGGLFDPARNYWDIPKKNEDFGQTMGHYGAGPGFYLVLPFFGPSSLRDGVGTLVDFLPDPMTYLLNTFEYCAVDGGVRVNYTSLHIGDYEQIKREAIDPYIFIKDAYAQHRAGQIKE